MVNGLGRAGLGRRRHRGRGGHAGPAGQPARPAGRRLQAPRGSCRPARPRPTSSCASWRCSARRAWSGSSSSSTGRASRASRSPTARRSPTWRPSTARRAASSRSTRRRSRYLRFTGRSEEHVALVEAYAREQGLFHSRGQPRGDVLATRSRSTSPTVVPSIAGPKRPQDRIALDRGEGRPGKSASRTWAARPPRSGEPTSWGTASVVIAAITSCTNTSNPSVMLGAGLLAQKAVGERGLTVKPWVKTSLAPGSRS